MVTSGDVCSLFTNLTVGVKVVNTVGEVSFLNIWLILFQYRYMFIFVAFQYNLELDKTSWAMFM